MQKNKNKTNNTQQKEHKTENKMQNNQKQNKNRTKYNTKLTPHSNTITFCEKYKTVHKTECKERKSKERKDTHPHLQKKLTFVVVFLGFVEQSVFLCFGLLLVI